MATHSTVSAFQFFKNDKLKIWFKRPEYAVAVARALVSGEVQPSPASLLLAPSA